MPRNSPRLSPPYVSHHAVDSLDVPQPDRGPSCKAMIGYCQAVTVWMAASVGVLHRLVELNRSPSVIKLPEQQLSAEVGTGDLCKGIDFTIQCTPRYCC